MANTSCIKYALTGMGQECNGAVAGLKRLLIGLAREWNVTEDTSASATPHSVTVSAATSGDVKFYEYYIMDESSSLTSQLNVNNQNGVRYYSNVVNATFVRMRPEKHIELMALAAEKLIIIAEDNNDQFWVIGGLGGDATATSETAQTGQSFDDLSGYQLEFTARSNALPWYIEESELAGKIDTPAVYED